MNASKTLIAAIAAATIVGTAGFVSAQTNDTTSPAKSVKGTEPVPGAASTSRDTRSAPSNVPMDMSSPPYVAPATESSPAPSESASPMTSTPADPTSAQSAASTSPDKGALTEPAPKADRN